MIHEHEIEEMNAAGGIQLTAALMTDPKIILAFMFAGKAKITIRGKEKRYTYLIKRGDLRKEDEARGYTQPPYWVEYLVGQDNENDYMPLGMIQFGLGGKTPKFKVTRNVKSATRDGSGNPKPMQEQAPHIKGFNMVFEALLRNQLISGFAIWHEGVCARCSRTLSDDESIKRGFGPTCFELVGREAGIQQFYVSMFPVAALGLAAGTETVKSTSPGYTGSTYTQPVKPHPRTPAAVIAAVNEDEEIEKLANELWATNPANPINQPENPPSAEPLPVEQKTAEALARSQGWTVSEAVEALSRRRIVNLAPRAKISKAEDAVLNNDWSIQVDGVSTEPTPVLVAENDVEVRGKIKAIKEESIEDFTMDGIMSEQEAFNFWYRRFATTPNLVAEG